MTGIGLSDPITPAMAFKDVTSVAVADASDRRIGGLVLSRRLGQSVVIGDDIEVEVVGLRSGTVRLRVAAPLDVAVHRREVFDAIQAEPRPAPSGDQAISPRAGRGALVLTRHRGESIMIGDAIALDIVDIRPGQVRLRVGAPREISVHRREVFDAIRVGEVMAGPSTGASGAI